MRLGYGIGLSSWVRCFARGVSAWAHPTLAVAFSCISMKLSATDLRRCIHEQPELLDKLSKMSLS
jgi:hypothetical protein